MVIYGVHVCIYIYMYVSICVPRVEVLARVAGLAFLSGLPVLCATGCWWLFLLLEVRAGPNFNRYAARLGRGLPSSEVMFRHMSLEQD